MTLFERTVFTFDLDGDRRACIAPTLRTAEAMLEATGITSYILISEHPLLQAGDGGTVEVRPQQSESPDMQLAGSDQTNDVDAAAPATVATSALQPQVDERIPPNGASNEPMPSIDRSEHGLIVDDFTGMTLTSQDLRDRNLDGAVFTATELIDVDFSGATLKGATFERSRMKGVRFIGIDATGANFRSARAGGADFTSADLTDAAFDRSDLEGSVFRRADLSRTSFEDADLTDADLATSRGAGTRFDGALLRRTTFADARLVDASFVDATIIGEGPSMGSEV